MCHMQRTETSEKMNSGEFVLIDYVGRIKNSGEIFDLTREDEAKKAGIYKKDFKYGPVPVVIDGNFVLPGLNNALKEMKVGEKRKVVIQPEKGFGKRSDELIKLIPEPKFKENNIDATPGSFVTINTFRGRIVSIDGGRVKVDFNHPLAGKELEYEVEVISLINDVAEKARAIVYYFTGLEKEKIEVSIKEKGVEITTKKELDPKIETKEIITKNIMKWINELEEVRFVDVFEKE